MDGRAEMEAGSGADDIEDDNPTDESFGRKWAWQRWTDVVAHKSCGGVWTVAERLGIVRFLNIVSYCHDEENEKKRQMEEWNRKHKK